MDKIFIDRFGKMEKLPIGPDRRRHITPQAGKTVKYYVNPDRRKGVRFPVCLSLKGGHYDPKDCLDFILNLSKGDVFIKTGINSPIGFRLTLHFYIPPDAKLLGIFQGDVVKLIHGPPHERGIQVHIVNYFREDMQRLEEYLEERRPLFHKVI